MRSSVPPRMAIDVIALDDLGADRVRVQAEIRQDLGLDVRAEMAVRPDRTRDLARPDLIHGHRQTRPAAIDFERPTRELETHRRRFGMHRVGPTHHRRVGFRPGAGDERGDEPVRSVKEPLPGGA